MDSPDTPRVARNARELNLIGDFSGSIAATKDYPTPQECTLRIFTEEFEIPELGLSLEYGQVNDITAGTIHEVQGVLGETEPGQRIILIDFKGENSDKKLALSWVGKGIDSIEYAEIMLYRAFAAHKVRSKNNGAPSYGVVGY